MTHAASSRGADAVRRVVDVGVAVVGMVVLAPVFLAAAAAVRVRMGSPVLNRQQRLGRDAEPFHLLKFRSMHPAAPGKEGPEYDHARLGRLGRFLRASSHDTVTIPSPKRPMTTGANSSQSSRRLNSPITARYGT